jgi:hypothetical protein
MIRNIYYFTKYYGVFRRFCPLSNSKAYSGYVCVVDFD